MLTPTNSFKNTRENLTEMGKIIDYQNKLLVEEKLKKYSIIESEDTSVTSSGFFMTSEKKLNDFKEERLKINFNENLNISPLLKNKRLEKKLDYNSDKKMKIESIPNISKLLLSKINFKKFDLNSLNSKNLWDSKSNNSKNLNKVTKRLWSIKIDDDDKANKDISPVIINNCVVNSEKLIQQIWQRLNETKDNKEIKNCKEDKLKESRELDLNDMKNWVMFLSNCK